MVSQYPREKSFSVYSSSRRREIISIDFMVLSLERDDSATVATSNILSGPCKECGRRVDTMDIDVGGWDGPCVKDDKKGGDEKGNGKYLAVKCTP